MATMTSGSYEGFVKGLVFDQMESSGGFVSMQPIVFKESVKVVGAGNFYYNIDYQVYPNGTQLEYEDEESPQTAKTLLENVGYDPKNTSNDSVVTHLKFSCRLQQTVLN